MSPSSASGGSEPRRSESPGAGASPPSEGSGAEASGRAEIATLGGGCFWCLDPVYSELRGVRRVTVGYAGGHAPEPSYEQVCTGETGHAEVVQVAFDPEEISYREILEIFFSVHDPTQRDRQGPDVGTQYRSIILHGSPEQRDIAEALIRELESEGVWRGIVTEVEPLETFWPAEEYHQDFYRKNPGQGYCRAVVGPKLAKFRKRFKDRLTSREAPA